MYSQTGWLLNTQAPQNTGFVKTIRQCIEFNAITDHLMDKKSLKNTTYFDFKR